LAELLVVVGVVAVMGLIITEVFSRSLKGGNKSQTIASIKQNGQASVELMDKTLRGADQVICPVKVGDGLQTSDTLVVVKDGKYSRFRCQIASGTASGQIKQDSPTIQPNQDQNSFLTNVCDVAYDDPGSSAQAITDTNTKSGVSVSDSSGNCTIFTRNKKSGFKDTVTIKFNLSPGVSAPSAIAGQIDAVKFTTTIGLR